MRTKNSTLKNVSGTKFNVNKRMKKKVVDESVHARIYVRQRVGGTYVHQVPEKCASRVHHSVCYMDQNWTRINLRCINIVAANELAANSSKWKETSSYLGKIPTRSPMRPVHQSSAFSVRFSMVIISPFLNPRSPS